MSEQEWLQQPGDDLNPSPFTRTHNLGPAAEAEQATIVAVFRNAEAARACFRNLRAREVQVSLEVVDEGAPAVEEQLRERTMGRGVVLGATVGATAGFLAGTYLVPPGAVTATGTMLTTLAGAGLGSFVGSLVDRSGLTEGTTSPAGSETGEVEPDSPVGRTTGVERRTFPGDRATGTQRRSVPGDKGARAAGPASAAAGRRAGEQAGTWRLVATVERSDADEVMDLIAPWKPGELRVE